MQCQDCHKQYIDTSAQKQNTESENVTGLKTPILLLDKSNVAYSIPCQDCHKQYVYFDSSSQKLKNRLTEHGNYANVKPYATAISMHVNTKSTINNVRTQKQWISHIHQ